MATPLTSATVFDGPVTVQQSTHDALNANVNLQIGDADVANGNPVPVSDAGGSLTVDGTVAVSSVGGTVTIQEPISVDDGGGVLTVDTPYIFNAVAGPSDSVWPLGMIRIDTLSTLIPVVGDYITGRCNNRGALWTKHDGTITTATGLVENAVVAAGHSVWPAGVVRDDALSTLGVADGDWTELNVDAQGALWVTQAGISGDPNIYFVPSAGFEVPACTLLDPDTTNPAGCNGPLGLHPSGALRTGPDRDGISGLFSSQVFNATTSANSSSVSTVGARWLLIYIELTETGSATDIVLIPQFSTDSGTTWFDYSVDQWVDLRYVVGQMPLNEVVPLNYVCGALFRLRAVATGTDGSNTITLSADVELVS